MSRYEFRLTDIGEGIAEAELAEWFVAVGDTVAEDQSVASVMTDKATVELESPVAGTVTQRNHEVGEQVRVGALLLAIETDADVPADDDKAKPEPDPTPAPAPAPEAERAPEPAARRIERRPSAVSASAAVTGKVLASPVVRRRASDLGIDISAVPHDGPRVMNADLDTYLRRARQPQQTRAKGDLQDREISVIGLRRLIARRMAEAKDHIPHFTYVEEIDMTEFERLRKTLGSQTGQPALTQIPLLIAAICRTLPEFPQLNAHYYDDKEVIRRFGAVHFGIAVQTDAGLMVPVVRDADTKDIWHLAQAVADNAEQARAGSIAREALSGSTITLTSLGKLGGIASTPIINRPEVCIIAPNRIVERPMWIGGMPVPRMMMNISISCDHRVIDGHDAAAFVQALKRSLETPALIFIES